MEDLIKDIDIVLTSSKKYTVGNYITLLERIKKRLEDDNRKK